MLEKTPLQGSTLIILPGWSGSHETWADFVALSKPHFKEVKVIDLPCFGDEPCPSAVWGVEEYADFVKEKILVLRHLERSRAKSRDPLQKQRDLSTPDSLQSSSSRDDVILLGHSFGGAVATHLVAKNSGVVDKLILAAPAIYRPKNYFRRTFFWGLAKVGKWVLQCIPSKRFNAFAKKVLYRAADSPDFDNTIGMRREIFKKIIRQDQRDLLPHITVPTLVVQGTNDSYVPYTYGKHIASAIPNAIFTAIEEGTHGLHKKTKHEFLHTVKSFV